VSLVERAAELERIRALVAEARRGDGGALIAVSGEPGAGKSSLIREALTGTTAHWGWCEPGLTPRPLGPFRDAVRSGALGDVDTGSRGDEDEPAERFLAAMQARPLVLVVEDAHWIDDASARTLLFLGRRIADTSGVIVVSFRGGIDPAHPLRVLLGDLATSVALERIELAPLTPAGVAELLQGSGRDAGEAHRVTGGNPFLVAALRDSPGEGISASVRDLAWSWARRLGPEALDLLTTLVVVPGRIDIGDLGHRAREVDELVGSGLLRLRGRHLEFHHELVRRALDRELTADQRGRAHDAAFRRLQARPDAEASELAFHALHAGLSEEALTHLSRAAEQAVASGAHTQAVEHYRRAVELAEGRLPDDEVARLCLALASEERFIGHDADARRYAAKGTALVDAERDPVLYAHSLMTRSRVAQSEAESLEFAERAATVLEERGSGAQFAGACASLASRLMVSRQLRPAATWARRALSLTDAEEDPETAVNALQALGSALTLLGEEDDCAHLRRAVELGTEAGLDQILGLAHCNLISAAGEARLYDVVSAATPDALAFFGAHDLDGLAGYTRAWLGRCAFEQGRWGEATRWVDDVLAVPEAAGDITVLTALCVRGRIRARRGDPAVAEPLVEARQVALGIGGLQRVAPIAIAQAEAAWLAGAPIAVDDLRSAFALAHELSAVPYLAELAFWLGRAGVATEPIPGVRGPWAPLLAGDHVAAAAAWSELGCPYEAAEAWAACDDVELLRRALETVDVLGAAPLRARVTRRMRELGVRSIPRGPRRATIEDARGLTAREQEVLGWLQRGSTDAEIAAGLHLSVKTVGHHVSSILRKTGAASRRELRGTPATGSADSPR
jgi:DNA-binding CsgD family transcriptional regulator/tetratricopeptide (TPR) repeat protein